MRTLLVSNRLPFTITSSSPPQFSISTGGLASALSSFTHSSTDTSSQYLWIGWPGSVIKKSDRQYIFEKALNKNNCIPVFLSHKAEQLYYNGFCNNTLWPLFHFFPSFTQFDESYWKMYKAVNTQFAATISSILQPDDIIFVHDYHLMLVPQLLRNYGFQNPIGFFLHTPFPTYDLFKILHLPWQRNLIQGILGSNLIGFHTSSYRNNFLDTVLATTTTDVSVDLGVVTSEKIATHTGVFPISIDYNYFNKKNSSIDNFQKKITHKFKNQKKIISVDRLDYSKEIYNRLKGFEIFLQNNRSYINKITFFLLLIPSRNDVTTYQQTRKSITKLIATINKKFATHSWQPVHAEHGTVSSDELITLYRSADVALITPARDGMNLVAKEFVASRTDEKGVLVLSKFAGAAHELSDSILVNPYYPHSIANGIQQALSLDSVTQQQRMRTMRKTIRNYDISAWAASLTTALQKSVTKKPLTSLQSRKRKLLVEYEQASRRLLLFDYDGTLVPLAPTPEKAQPTPEVLTLLYSLTQDKRNDICIISGRTKETLDHWLGFLPIQFSGEHGAWIKDFTDWRLLQPLSRDWKKHVKPLLELYTAGLTGSFIEEKDYSLAFHYRLSPQKMAEIKIQNMLFELRSYLANSPLHTIRGNKVIEIKYSSINKGLATFHFLQQRNYDFVLAVGDDMTDEDMFRVLPSHAYSIKIGTKESSANLRLSHPDRLHRLLEILAFKSEYSKKNILYA